MISISTLYSIDILAFTIFILPVSIGIISFQMGIRAAWLCVLLFVFVLFLLSAGRYRQGSWQKMLVIEESAR